jgi:hypothetical protein
MSAMGITFGAAITAGAFGLYAMAIFLGGPGYFFAPRRVMK